MIIVVQFMHSSYFSKQIIVIPKGDKTIKSVITQFLYLFFDPYVRE